MCMQQQQQPQAPYEALLTAEHAMINATNPGINPQLLHWERIRSALNLTFLNYIAQNSARN